MVPDITNLKYSEAVKVIIGCKLRIYGFSNDGKQCRPLDLRSHRAKLGIFLSYTTSAKVGNSYRGLEMIIYVGGITHKIANNNT